MMLVVYKRLSIQGISVHDLIPKYMEKFHKEVPPQVAKGQIKYAEDVTRGLEHTGKALLAMLKGISKAKSVVIVAGE
jgi:NADPH-dependent curcumin reductase CurA